MTSSLSLLRRTGRIIGRVVIIVAAVVLVFLGTAIVVSEIGQHRGKINEGMWALGGLPALAWARFTDLLSTPLRDVPLGVAIIIALLLIRLAAHWIRSDQ
jgi:hypothetical protein